MDYIHECAKDLDLPPEKYGHIFEPDYKPDSEDYFTAFDLRFTGLSSAAYQFLEDEMEGKTPNIGYYALAMVLTHTNSRLAITTNFDYLIEDALFNYTGKHPLVVNHESMAGFISNDTSHPVVAKVHRGLLYGPMNRQEEIAALAEQWKAPLQDALEKYIPIVIGYAGGDGSLMRLLEDTNLKRIYWCTLKNEAPTKRIQDVIEGAENGYRVSITGFDGLLVQIALRLAAAKKFPEGESVEKLAEKMRLAAEARCKKYLDDYKEIVGGNDAAGQNITPEERDTALAAAKLRQTTSEQEALEQQADIAYWECAFEKALPLYQQLSTLDPVNGQYHFRLGYILQELKHFKEAIAAYTKAIQLDPDDVTAYNNRGNALDDLNRYEEAIADYDKAIELKPDYAKAYYNRGIALDDLNRYEEAIADFTKAIELKPDYTLAYHNRSNTLRRLKRYTEATADKQKAHELEGAAMAGAGT